jgi:hypothetical protein
MRQIILALVTLILLTVASSALALRDEWVARCTAHVAYAHCVAPTGKAERSGRTVDAAWTL